MILAWSEILINTLHRRRPYPFITALSLGSWPIRSSRDRRLRRCPSGAQKCRLPSANVKPQFSCLCRNVRTLREEIHSATRPPLCADRKQRMYTGLSSPYRGTIVRLTFFVWYASSRLSDIFVLMRSVADIGRFAALTNEFLFCFVDGHEGSMV